MENRINRLVRIVSDKYKGCKNLLRFDEYKFKIYSSHGTESEKKNAVRTIAMIMEVKP
jgi:hypothetical protein